MSTISQPQQQQQQQHLADLQQPTGNSSAKNIKPLKTYSEEEEKFFHQRCKRSACDWSLPQRKKIKRTSEKRAAQQDEQDDEQYHCVVFLKFYSSTLKCSIDVVVVAAAEPILPPEQGDDPQSILIGKSRISRSLKPGVVRVRLVSSLFVADADVHEDAALTKLETIRKQKKSNHFDKQFALLFKNDRFGPGVIGKLFVEPLDPQTGSYTNTSPIFELNLSVATQQNIRSTSFDQKINTDSISTSLPCGCLLSSDPSRINISEQCNLKFNDMKLTHRLAEPLRCQWKSIGRELFPCFNETDLLDFQQSYFLTEGNQECTFQLLREWFVRAPHQANTRYLFTRLKLPHELLVSLHNDVLTPYLS